MRFDKSEPNSIGVWCNEQRERYRNNKMSEAQIKQFKKFHDWRWDFDDWDEIFTSVQNLCAEKDCVISNLSEDEKSSSGQNLRIWLSNQRKKVKKGLLTSDQITKLESLPGWFLDDTSKWMKNYESALNFSNNNKHMRVPRGALNSWIKRQRKSKKSLTKEQINLLEGIGYWSWDPVRDAWIRGISELSTYQKKYNNLLVSQKYISENNHALGIWVNKCRMEYKADKLTQERIRDLEAFDNWVWEPLTYKWDEIYSKVLSIWGRQKNFRDIEVIPGIILGKWHRLQMVNLDKLSEERQRLLAKLSDNH